MPTIGLASASLDLTLGLRYSSIGVPNPSILAMKKILASIITVTLIIAMTLAAMFTLVSATVYVTAIPSPAQRAAAVGAEIVLGVVLLLGTTWLATHLAVRIFHHDEPVDPGAPLV